jgi:hypothetical protein
VDRIRIGLWQLDLRARRCVEDLRICRVWSIVERKPPNPDIAVLAFGEPMGS